MSAASSEDLEAGEESYFVSMTDMMVGMVFIFIILLMYFALQFRDVTDQLAGADRTRAEILQQLQRSLKAKGVDVTIDTQNGVLRLPDAILFDSGDPELKPGGETAVAKLADALEDVLPCYTLSASNAPRKPGCAPTRHFIESLYIEGHTDSDRLVGSGMLKDNWDLSAERATNTYRALTRFKPQLTDRCARQGEGCAPVLSVSGYGPERPVDLGTSEAAKQRNRRIDLRIIMVTPDAGDSVRALGRRLEAR